MSRVARKVLGPSDIFLPYSTQVGSANYCWFHASSGWEGAVEIIKKINDTVYRIKSKTSKKAKIIHVNRRI